eukprot:TRINITY_DN7070_c0_g1_i1.p1 TRINITY_DN7070_c0_g1~~TRINITY_DN7070_c0_g1_i1.p1  ORF type:complete len:124 (+),score=33.06 TRINITY_DN7070_c0_g1_i1:144-515(+)
MTSTLPSEVPHDSGVPMMFNKMGYMPVGSAGVISYDIGDTPYRIAVMWMVPWHNRLWDNWFNVKIMPKGETNHKTYKELYHKANPQRASEGEMSREEIGFMLKATMSAEETSVLMVELGSQPQ